MDGLTTHETEETEETDGNDAGEVRRQFHSLDNNTDDIRKLILGGNHKSLDDEVGGDVNNSKYRNDAFASRNSVKTFTTLPCPEEGATIAFHEYSYQVGDNLILDNISGQFLAGRFTAIMGPSGSGKTTLIETLTGSNLGSSKKGVTFKCLTLNGVKCSRDDIAAISGFVAQDDYFLPTITVREAIMTSATLRLPRSVFKKERDLRTKETLEVLNLTKNADSTVGGLFRRGISGGEKRRLSIARELIANPPILFTDEPTTGLDSFTALTVAKKLKNLAQQGRTVVATVHQPSSEIFKLFDDLVLLVQGQVLYWGRAAKCIKYFKTHGFECPQYANPSDFLFMEIMRPFSVEGMRSGLSETSSTARIAFLVDKWKESYTHLQIVAAASNPDSTKNPKIVPIISKASFAVQFTHLYKDYLVTGMRRPLSIPLRLVFALYSGLMIGLTYLLIRNNDFQQQIRGRAGAISYMMTLAFIGGYSGAVQSMNYTRDIFMREYRSHYYDVTPAYFARVAFLVPLDFAFGMMLGLICYYMVGLNPAFSAYLFVSMLAGLCQTIGVLAGYTMGYSVRDVRKLVASAIISLLPFTIFGGLIIVPHDIPGYLRWLVYLDPIYYAFTAGMQVGYPPCPDAQSASENNPVVPCQRTVAFERFGINDALPAGINVVLLITLGIAVFFTGWISLYINARFRSK